MPKYLVKRRNNWGIWAHMETLEYPPSRYEIENRYGPGEYEILIAQENVIGLRHYDNFSIPWNVELTGHWIPGQPTQQWVANNLGQGYYFIIGNASFVEPVIVPSPFANSQNGQQYARELMNQGSAAMRNIYVPFRVRLPW